MENLKKAKRSGCLAVLLAVFAILVLYAVVSSRGREKIHVSNHRPMPTVSRMYLPEPEPETPKAPPRHIVCDSYSQARSSAAIDAGCRVVMQSHVKLAAGRFDRANAGVSYYSDGTFDVSGQVAWLPSVQSAPVVSFFHVTVWERGGEWFWRDLKMSGYGF